MAPVSIEKSTYLTDSIITCFTTYIKKYGYKRTTMDDVVGEINISKKTLYEIFPSKSDIVRESAWRDIRSVVAGYSDTMPRSTSTDELLLGLCRHIFTDRIKNGRDGAYWGVHHDEAAISDAYGEALMRIMSHLYLDAQKHGRVKPVPPGTAIRIVYGMVRSACDSFSLSARPVAMFHDVLLMISDAVAFRDRIPFDDLG